MSNLNIGTDNSVALTTDELVAAKEAVARLLDELRLAAYLFEVEPREGDWEVRIECELEDGWRITHLDIAKDDILASARDPLMRASLLRTLRTHLGNYRRRGAAPGSP